MLASLLPQQSSPMSSSKSTRTKAYSQDITFVFPILPYKASIPPSTAEQPSFLKQITPQQTLPTQHNTSQQPFIPPAHLPPAQPPTNP